MQITRMRHALSAELRSGIDQSYWHSGQILFPQHSDGHIDIVFIEFAFAYQRFGDELGKGKISRMEHYSYGGAHISSIIKIEDILG